MEWSELEAKGIKPYYKDESVFIIHSDCRLVLPLIPDKSIDLVLTDPPYKLSKVYGSTLDVDNLEAVSSLIQVLPLCESILKNDRLLVAFYDNRILPFLFSSAKSTKLTYLKSIYLYHRWGVAHKWGGWMQCTDPVCFFVKGSLVWGEGGKVKHDCYIKTSPELNGTGHPSQKPNEITEDIIRWCSQPDDLILDPFLGSGTTAFCAKKLGRKCIGIEISEKYCEIAAKRCSQGVLLTC